MIIRRNMLVLGSTGRNVGKTEFACRLITRYAATHAVVGIKITTIKERDGRCPRGGKGCGVCSSLQGNYCITEEHEGPANKDTVRMLSAGAHKVYWLRVLKEHLAEGIAELLDLIPVDALVIAESNSSRLVLKPGLFLVVRERGSTTVKASCQDVIHLADKVFDFDGADWDVSPTQCLYTAGRWHWVPPISAAILAGGKSSRMGQDKSMMSFQGQPMIQHIANQLHPLFASLSIGANDAERYAFLKLPVVPDEALDKGPLMGILSCVAHAPTDLVFVIGCDIPQIQRDLIAQLITLAPGYDIVMPRNAEGRHEPLFALYRQTIVDPARAIIARGGRRIVELFDPVKVRFVDMPDTGWYHNLNTMADFNAAEQAQTGRTSDD